MALGVAIVVLFAGVIHATWNAIAARAGDATATMLMIGLTDIVIAVPMLLVLGLPRAGAYPFAVASALIHVAYNAALLRSYRLGGFSRAYPLARGSSVLLVAVGAWLIAAERLAGRQLAGVSLVVVALAAIAFASGRPRRDDLPAIAAALLTGATIAAYSVCDGLGARHSGAPPRYLALLFVLQGPMIVAAALAAPGRPRALPPIRTIRFGAAAGALSLLAYGLVIWAQTRAPLALVSALRETSVISAALIATLVFHEPVARRRILPAVAVAAGVLLIAV
jgi:drug/metabolite transporter (DMT)-like permease